MMDSVRGASCSRRPHPLTRRPTVTVVVPCYNYGHYLPTAVASVLGQSGVEVDLIVIDDASTDGSAAIVSELGTGDDRIRAILHERNRGHIATYNEGLEQATGDYFLLMSADDALPPGCLARATALLEAHPSVGLAYGHPVVFSDDPPIEVNTRVRNWTIWSGEAWIERMCRRGTNCIMNPEAVLRTSVQQAIGGYDAKLPLSGDMEMWMRAAAVSDVGRVNGAPQGFYRVHSSSMQRTTYAGYINDLEGRLAAFEKVLVGPDVRIARADELFATARRALASSALGYARSAYDHGRATQEPIDAYMAFAARVWPVARGGQQWRALERCASADPRRPVRALSAIRGRVADDLRGRVRWQRWRWSGV